MFAKSVRICRLQTTHWHFGKDTAVRGWGRGGGKERRKKREGGGGHNGHSRSNPNFSSPGRGEFQHIGPGNQHQQRLTDTPRHASRVKRLCTETGASGIPPATLNYLLCPNGEHVRAVFVDKQRVTSVSQTHARAPSSQRQRDRAHVARQSRGTTEARALR